MDKTDENFSGLNLRLKTNLLRSSYIFCHSVTQLEVIVITVSI